MSEQKPLKILKFFDKTAKRVFRTSNYSIIKRKGKIYAVANSPYSDMTSWRLYKG